MAVTANQLIKKQEGEKQSYPVAASTHIYQGTLIFLNGAGYALDSTSTGECKFAGVAISEIDNSSGAAGDLSVEVWTDEDVFELTGSGFTQADVGKPCYATDNYTITTTYSASAVRIGRVSEYVSSTKLRVKLNVDSSADLRFVQLAAGTAVTNTITETSLGSTETIKANTLRPGDILRIHGQVIATATNSTDTLTVKAYIGSTAYVTTGAVDVANNDICTWHADIVVRTIGASGTIVGMADWNLGVPGTATTRAGNLASTTIDTTADITLDAKATWSVANAGNSCRLDIHNIQLLRKGG